MAISGRHWQYTDAIIEVERTANAETLYKFFDNVGVKLFSQKVGWTLVTDFNHMPTSYKDGMLFASCKDRMPW